MRRLFFGSRPEKEAGFTLVEIMIAGAIAIFIALAVSELIVYTTRKDLSIKTRQDVINYQQQIRYENRVVPPPSPDP